MPYGHLLVPNQRVLVPCSPNRLLFAISLCINSPPLATNGNHCHKSLELDKAGEPLSLPSPVYDAVAMPSLTTDPASFNLDSTSSYPQALHQHLGLRTLCECLQTTRLGPYLYPNLCCPPCHLLHTCSGRTRQPHCFPLLSFVPCWTSTKAFQRLLSRSDFGSPNPFAHTPTQTAFSDMAGAPTLLLLPIAILLLPPQHFSQPTPRQHKI